MYDNHITGEVFIHTMKIAACWYPAKKKEYQSVFAAKQNTHRLLNSRLILLKSRLWRVVGWVGLCHIAPSTSFFGSLSRTSVVCSGMLYGSQVADSDWWWAATFDQRCVRCRSLGLAYVGDKRLISTLRTEWRYMLGICVHIYQFGRWNGSVICHVTMFVAVEPSFCLTLA